jgi:hypothetical protein
VIIEYIKFEEIEKRLLDKNNGGPSINDGESADGDKKVK